MKVTISATKQELGLQAAKAGAERLRAAISARGRAYVIVATGASQFEMLDALVREPDIDWSKVEICHLDEYVGLPEDHPAGFRKYLRERFLAKLPVQPARFHPVSRDALDDLNRTLAATTIDVAFVGIGENAHLAFNDPPADFDSDVPYLVLSLDEDCRKQQLGEGWFKTLADVPAQAVSMSIKQIMKSRAIIVTVPDARKAKAVKGALEGPVTNVCPSSILQRHADCQVFLDRDSASLLRDS